MFDVSGQRLARLTIRTIEKMCNDESAEMFFDCASKMTASHKFIEEAELGRRKRKPNYSILHYLDGCESTPASHDPAIPRNHYRQVLFDVVDVFVSSLKERFEQESYNIYASIENLPLCAINCDEVFTEGLEVLKTPYPINIDTDSLLVELAILKEICKDSDIACFGDLHEFLMKIPTEDCNLIPNVVLACMRLLINPATSATPDRSFSLSRLIKTWQRSTMAQKRFNATAILHCHGVYTDLLDLVAVGNEFVSKHDERKVKFGTFIASDKS